jgi:hypothetical protein
MKSAFLRSVRSAESAIDEWRRRCRLGKRLVMALRFRPPWIRTAGMRKGRQERHLGRFLLRNEFYVDKSWPCFPLTRKAVD